MAPVEKIVLKGSAKMSLDQRFSKMNTVAAKKPALKQPMVASSKNQKFATQLATKPSVQAALRPSQTMDSRFSRGAPRGAFSRGSSRGGAFSARVGGQTVGRATGMMSAGASGYRAQRPVAYARPSFLRDEGPASFEGFLPPPPPLLMMNSSNLIPLVGNLNSRTRGTRGNIRARLTLPVKNRLGPKAGAHPITSPKKGGVQQRLGGRGGVVVRGVVRGGAARGTGRGGVVRGTGRGGVVRGAARGGVSRGAPGRGGPARGRGAARGRGRGGAAPAKKVTADDLDKDLTSYMAKTAGFLDNELDDYMTKK